MTFVVRFLTTNVMMQSEKPIMIVDDESDITYIMKKALQRKGIAVDAFNDAELALSHFKPDTYELIILDIRMPRMNGFELYQEIRKIDALVKVCFLSANEMCDVSTGAQSEIRCVIKKPIRMADLVNHIRLEVAPLLV